MRCCRFSHHWRYWKNRYHWQFDLDEKFPFFRSAKRCSMCCWRLCRVEFIYWLCVGQSVKLCVEFFVFSFNLKLNDATCRKVKVWRKKLYFLWNHYRGKLQTHGAIFKKNLNIIYRHIFFFPLYNYLYSPANIICHIVKHIKFEESPSQYHVPSLCGELRSTFAWLKPQDTAMP